MIGYKDRPKVNADTFDSEGFMHTGDVVEVDDDGYIYVVDRVKEVSYLFCRSFDFQLILIETYRCSSSNTTATKSVGILFFSLSFHLI
jgi:acyl-CoA synthetase (AMP-forming)/AMP-acid ligase II